MTSVRPIGSQKELNQLFREWEEHRKKQDAAVTEELIEKAVPGACFIRFYEMPEGILTIYGEVIEPTYEEDKALYQASHMLHKRPTRCYSEVETLGEYGNMHIVDMHVFIDRPLFDVYRAQGWPSLM